MAKNQEHFININHREISTACNVKDLKQLHFKFVT